ncbi:MAG: hypothetical protein HY548_00785 [Elusimicrobia bacterium]|nr:hypothetical protein [Elusimicrobiota bacterium]
MDETPDREKKDRELRETFDALKEMNRLVLRTSLWLIGLLVLGMIAYLWITIHRG